MACRAAKRPPTGKPEKMVCWLADLVGLFRHGGCSFDRASMYLTDLSQHDQKYILLTPGYIHVTPDMRALLESQRGRGNSAVDKHSVVSWRDGLSRWGKLELRQCLVKQRKEGRWRMKSRRCGRLVRRRMLAECYLPGGTSSHGNGSSRIVHCFKHRWTNLSALVVWVSLRHQCCAHPASGHSVKLTVGRMEKIGTR